MFFHGKYTPAVLTFKEALEYGGMPLSYFPETMPQARGDQVMAPTPEREREDRRGQAGT